MRHRHRVLAIYILSVIGAVTALELYAARLVFVAGSGNVTYNHKAHTLRQKFNCLACHVKTFSLYRASLNFKEVLHKTAEAEKTSCGQCHRPGGEAFESRGNCKKCHVRTILDPGADI
jgi:c(7)-type cytochrome triheme protein